MQSIGELLAEVHVSIFQLAQSTIL